jgi:hypothetical protein
MSKAAKVYADKDANLAVLKNKTLAVLGFGSQGHAHALNLKESGLQCHHRPLRRQQVHPRGAEKGFKVYSTAEAVRRADVIFVAIAGHQAAGGLREGHRAEPDEGQDAAVLARLRDPFQNHRAAEKCGRDSRRAERAGTYRAPAISRKAKACPH